MIILDKREVDANYDTDIIKLALLDRHIVKVPVSGTYKINNAIVKRYGSAVTVTTDSKSKIYNSSEQIEPTQVMLEDLVTHQVRLHADNVHSLTKRCLCPKCNKYYENVTTNVLIFKCSSCKTIKKVEFDAGNVKTVYLGHSWNYILNG